MPDTDQARRDALAEALTRLEARDLDTALSLAIKLLGDEDRFSSATRAELRDSWQELRRRLEPIAERAR